MYWSLIWRWMNGWQAIIKKFRATNELCLKTFLTTKGTKNTNRYKTVFLDKPLINRKLTPSVLWFFFVTFVSSAVKAFDLKI